MRLNCRALRCLLLALFAQGASSFLPSHSSSRRTAITTTAFHTRPSHRLAKKDDDNDEGSSPGMSDAFRQLDSLQSLGEDKTDESKAATPPPPISADTDTVKAEKLTPEKEAQMYSNMMKDLESTDDDELYSNVLSEMGGDPTTKPPSSDVDIPTPTTLSSSSKPDMDQFMEQALNQALDEVKLKDSKNLSAESILNDKEIMKEIEAIFDRGSAQLMEELEEIRKEQTSLAEQSAASSAQDGANAVTDEAARMAQAQASMAKMLERVNQEAVQVEQAAQDLQKAQQELDQDFVVKLRNGGLPKQMALAGFLLFSVRSILDTVASFSDESLLAGALLQGGIAIVCAGIFFVL